MTKGMTFGQWWRSLTDGQQQAWAQKIHQGAGGDASALKNFDGLIRDELVAHVTFKDGAAVLVDRNGRVIPITGMKGIVDADRSFYLTQPDLDYVTRLARLQEYYGKDMKFMSAAEFEDRCGAALERVRTNRQIANLVKGPHFPFAIPHLQGDLGTLLDDTMVPAMERSYKAQFSQQRPFTNYRRGELAGQVTVIPATRQDRLIEAMAKGPVCGVYFPALQGFGITADREMIGHLPENLILSGMEVPVVVTAYPEITGRDFKTPGLDMASLQWQSADYSLIFKAHDDEASFDQQEPRRERPLLRWGLRPRVVLGSYLAYWFSCPSGQGHSCLWHLGTGLSCRRQVAAIFSCGVTVQRFTRSYCGPAALFLNKIMLYSTMKVG